MASASFCATEWSMVNDEWSMVNGEWSMIELACSKIRISLRIIIPIRVMSPKIEVSPKARSISPRPISAPGIISPNATIQMMVMPYFLKLNNRKKNTMTSAMVIPAKICGKASSPNSISPPTSVRTLCGICISSCIMRAISFSTGAVKTPCANWAVTVIHRSPPRCIILLSLHRGCTLAICRKGTVVLVLCRPPDTIDAGDAMPRFAISEKVISVSSFTTMGSS